MKKFCKTKFEIEAKYTNLQKAKKLLLQTPFFSALDFTYSENFKRFHRSKMKKSNLSQITLANTSLCGILAQERKSLYKC